TPSEALYLKKKLLVIPMKNQYEQQCNAMALKEIGVPVIYDFNIKSIKKLKDWISSKKIVGVDFSESPNKVINQLFIDYIKMKSKEKILCNYN
ncbi:MAG: glycosyl transferase, partial [Flavobacteriaceae bacterium]|nr:glycosyl transferase [Flavobacteriaceae bacterium]